MSRYMKRLHIYHIPQFIQIRDFYYREYHIVPVIDSRINLP